MVPSNIWFNQILSRLTDKIKNVPSLANNWIINVSKRIQISPNKFRSLVLVMTLFALVSTSDAQTRGLVNYESGYQPENFYVSEGGESSDGIEHIMSLYGYENHKMLIKKEDIIMHINTKVEHIQDAAIQFVEQLDDTETILEIFSRCESLNVKQVLLGRLIANKKIDVVSRIFYMSETFYLGQNKVELNKVIDTLVISAIMADPDYFSDIGNIEYQPARQRLKFMLTYYAQTTDGEIQRNFTRSLFKVCDRTDLLAMVNAYSDSSIEPEDTGVIFDYSDSSIIYAHSNSFLQMAAREKLLEKSLETKLRLVASHTSTGVKGKLTHEDRLDAQDLLRLLDSGDPDFINMTAFCFPSIYRKAQLEVDNTLPFSAQYSQNMSYNRKPSAFILREVNRFVSFDIGNDMVKQNAADLNFRISNWPVIDNYLRYGINHALKINIIQRYYTDYTEKLTQLYDHFSIYNTDIADEISIVLEKKLAKNPSEFFDMNQFSYYKIRYLLKFSRQQRKFGVYPYTLNYLLKNYPSGYSLAKILHSKSLVGLELSDEELSMVRKEITRRFAIEELSDLLEDLKNKHQSSIFSRTNSEVSSIEQDLQMLESFQFNNIDIVITKYNLTKKYHKYLDKLELIVAGKYKRLPIYIKLIKNVSVPFGISAGVLIFFFIYRQGSGTKERFKNKI